MDQASVLRFLEDIIASSSEKLSVKLDADDGIDTIEDWDSLITVSIAVALSSEFGINLDLDDLEKITTVKGVMDVVGAK